MLLLKEGKNDIDVDSDATLLLVTWKMDRKLLYSIS